MTILMFIHRLKKTSVVFTFADIAKQTNTRFKRIGGGDVQASSYFLMPKVYNRRNRLEARPLDAVYVGRGRGSHYGNPFREGRDGTREEVIAKFEAYALERLEREPDWLAPLRGKDLVCWCAPKSCHADVLLRLANLTFSELC